MQFVGPHGWAPSCAAAASSPVEASELVASASSPASSLASPLSSPASAASSPRGVVSSPVPLDEPLELVPPLPEPPEFRPPPPPLLPVFVVPPEEDDAPVPSFGVELLEQPSTVTPYTMKQARRDRDALVIDEFLLGMRVRIRLGPADYARRSRRTGSE
jgi:hypothetical protein